MRTNIDIDDDLMARAQKVTGLATKKAAVEEGLRLLVRLKEQEEVLKLAGKVRWQGDLAASREGRNTR
jgi:Arc/MetJ family transcription regulator